MWIAFVPAIMILIFTVVFVLRTGNDSTPFQPKGCTCLWFMNDEGPYRALADVNCRRHEGI